MSLQVHAFMSDINERFRQRTETTRQSVECEGSIHYRFIDELRFELRVGAAIRHDGLLDFRDAGQDGKPAIVK